MLFKRIPFKGAFLWGKKALRASQALSAFMRLRLEVAKMSFALDSSFLPGSQRVEGGKKGPCRCGVVGFCRVWLTCNLASWVCFLSSTMKSMVWAGGRAGCLEKDLRKHTIKAAAMLVPSCPPRRPGRGPPWLRGTASPACTEAASWRSGCHVALGSTLPASPTQVTPIARTFAYRAWGGLLCICCGPVYTAVSSPRGPKSLRRQLPLKAGQS